MTIIAARFLPARSADLAPEHLPRIPAWWPLQPSEGRRLAESERELERRKRAVREAIAGPIDGTTGEVQVDAGGPPARYVPLSAPTLWYRLSPRESTRDVAVYRYDPTCPAHAGMMDAIGKAYDEAGPDYVNTAREEDDSEHTAPAPERFTFAPPQDW